MTAAQEEWVMPLKPERYRRALETAIAELNADPEVVGIVWTGSVQQGSPARTSDLDLYVITNKSHTWRATKIYEGVVTELFVNNVPSMHWRITRPEEIASAAGFATGSILLDRTGEVGELQAIARQRWENPALELCPEQISMLRYSLTDLADDLDDVEEDPVTSRIVGAGRVQKALEAFCKIHRFHGSKSKRIYRYVAERDPLLGVMLRDYFARGMHAKHAQEIVDYVLAPVGGRLVEWESQKVPYPREGSTNQ